MSAPEYLYTPYRAVKGKLKTATGEALKVVKTTSSSETNAVLKDRFYLDFFVRMVDNTSGTPVRSWAGACYVGSENYYMHNLNRHGWIRCKEKNTGREYVVFWDAGLNTLGRTSYVSLVNKNGYGVVVTVSVKSAYYVDTDTVTVKWRPSSSSEWIYNSLAAPVSQGQDGFVDILLGSPDVNINGNEYIYIVTINNNAEGAKDESSISVFVPASGNKFGFGIYGSYAFADYDILTSPMYYFNTQYIQLGMEMYKDSNLLQNANVGYYADDTIWMKVESVGGKSVVTKMANVGNWDTGDPASPVRFTSRTFIGWSEDWSVGCANVNSLNPITIYLDNVDNVYRLTASATGALASGFYYTGTTSNPPGPAPEFIRIFNGITNNFYYNCRTGWTPLPD